MNMHGRSKRSLYDVDFFSWTQEQAGLLKTGQIDKVDLVNLAEEVETLGRSERSALVSAYRLICLHQFKRMIQPQRSESKSWVQTIVRERNNLEDILHDNPGLRPHRPELFARAYKNARREAAAETGLPPTDFPLEAPFSLDEIEDPGFWAKATDGDDHP